MLLKLQFKTIFWMRQSEKFRHQGIVYNSLFHLCEYEKRYSILRHLRINGCKFHVLMRKKEFVNVPDSVSEREKLKNMETALKATVYLFI